MTGNSRALQLSSASAFAIGMAIFLSPVEVSAQVSGCQTVLNPPVGTIASVSVTCSSGDTAAFSTVVPSGLSEDPPLYNGNGDDQLTISGGRILPSLVLAPPPFLTRGPPVELLGGNDIVTISGAGQIGQPPISGPDPIAGQFLDLLLGDGDDQFFLKGGLVYGSVQGEGGNDLFDISAGQIFFNVDAGIGDDTVRISSNAMIGAEIEGDTSVDLGDGTDKFIMTGGSLQGNVVGGLGVDTFDISGGTIGGSIFGGSDNDRVIVSGLAVIGVATGEVDSVGLEDGDDEFTMTGGELSGAVSGNLGNDRITIQNGTIGAFVEGNEGNDTINISGGQIVGQVIGDVGNDDITISGGTIGEDVSADDGDDQVHIFGGTIGTTLAPAAVDLGAGADLFGMSGGRVTGSVSGLGGGNTYIVSGGTISGSLFAGSENDSVTISGTANIGVAAGEVDSVGLEEGDDIFTMTGGTIAAGASGGADNDMMTIGGGSVGTFVAGNDGTDAVTVSGGEVNGDILGGLGNDTIEISGGQVHGFVSADEGNDTVRLLGGVVGTAADPTGVDLGAGADRYEMSGGQVFGDVFGFGGGNTFLVSGGTISGSLFAGSENDNVTISGTANIGVAAGEIDSIGLEGGDDTFGMTGGTLGGAVSGGGGDDTLTVSGGTIGSFLAGNEGADQISVSGGTIQDDVRGNEGVDEITVSGGTIAGDVEAETVNLFGGTIGGDITGISGNTLVINDAAVANPLSLRDGVIFSGTNAVGTITDTDLSAGRTKQQVFSGFDSLTLDNSALGFGDGTIGIGQLALGNGSTLFIDSIVNIPGTLTLDNSTLNLINGAADDVVTLGGLVLNNATIGLDLNQQTVQADQLVPGTFSASGVNIINVNLIGTPEFAEPTDIPIIITPGGSLAGSFLVQGIPGTPGSLFTFELLQGPNGLFIRASPANFGVAGATDSATNSGIVDTAIDALYGINDDAIDADLGLANGTRLVQITPTFGVFASGQFAHVEHDGFTITNSSLVGPGPDFDADDFSAAISLDFNAAKHFGFDDRYGLNLGLFGGYASTDVGLGAFQGFNAIGDGNNKSAMFGSYALFRQGNNYGLVSASAFLGETDISNGVLNTTGSYDTEGYAVTGSVGHIFTLTDRLRFDLRGGLLGVTFTGDDYVDSGGNQFGESRISFGAFKFEPGVYADYQLENGMVFSPYARADLQQRFGYRNTTSIDGREIDFDDADFSAALSTGFNLKMSERATVSSEVRGKLSADSSAVGGKLGLKIAF